MKTNDILRTLAFNKGLQVVAILKDEDGERVFDVHNAFAKEFAIYADRVFFDRKDFKKEYLKNNDDWISMYPIREVEEILDRVADEFFVKRVAIFVK